MTYDRIDSLIIVLCLFVAINKWVLRTSGNTLEIEASRLSVIIS